MFRERLTIGDVLGSTRDLARLHLGLVLFGRDSSRDEALKVWSQVKNEKLLGAAYSVQTVHAAFEAQTASEPRRTELRIEAEAVCAYLARRPSIHPAARASLRPLSVSAASLWRGLRPG
jgi:hypothetical protein